MKFKILVQKIFECFTAYSKRHDILVDPNYAAIKLIEEVGEFSQALLIHQKKCRESKYLDQETSKRKLGYELADVIGLALVNAEINGIDIEKAIDEKWIHREISKAWETTVFLKV